MSRLSTLRAGSARTAILAAAIRAAAGDPDIVLVRLQLRWSRYDNPRRHVEAYTTEFQPVRLDPDAVKAIDLLVRGRRPDIDWRVDHDWNLDTGMLRRSPGAADRGYIPEDDRAFGGAAPAFLIDSAVAQAGPEAAA